MLNRLQKFPFLGQNWFVAIVVISITPLVQSLLTTTLDGAITYGQSVVRILSVITILADIFVINIAIKKITLRNIDWRKNWKLPSLIIALFVIASISVFSQSTSIPFSIFITLRYALQIATLFALVSIISSSSTFNTEHHMSAMVACALLYIAYITTIALTVPDPSTFPWAGGLPSATSIRHIGNYSAIFSIAAMGSFLFLSDRYRWLNLAAVFAIIAFLGWTGSRAAFVGIGIALIPSLFFLRRYISATRVGILAATLVAAVIATILLPTPDPAFGVVRMINASDTSQSSDISSARIEIWQNTIHEIVAAPVLGHGAGRFIGNMSEKYGYDLDNPHNFVLQFAYDWGLIGLGIALVLLSVAGVSLYNLPIISPLATFCATSGFILMLSIGMLEGMFYHPLKMLLVSALVTPAFALARRGSGSNLLTEPPAKLTIF